MLYLVLGIVIGILLAHFSAFVYFEYKNNKRVQVNLRDFKEKVKESVGMSTKKVEFIAPMEEEAEAIASIIKKNDEEGKDTDFKELNG